MRLLIITCSSTKTDTEWAVRNGSVSELANVILCHSCQGSTKDRVQGPTEYILEQASKRPSTNLTFLTEYVVCGAFRQELWILFIAKGSTLLSSNSPGVNLLSADSSYSLHYSHSLSFLSFFLTFESFFQDLIFSFVLPFFLYLHSFRSLFFFISVFLSSFLQFFLLPSSLPLLLHFSFFLTLFLPVPLCYQHRSN